MTMTIDSLGIAVLLIVFVSTLVRTVFGFGNALVAMPLLAMTGLGIKTVSPLVALISLVLGTVLLFMDWKKVDIRSAWRLLLATVPGIPLGTLFLKGESERLGEFLLALIIIAFSSYSLYKPRLIELKHEWAAYPFGFLAGILGGAYNSNGPPVVIYGTFRRWAPDEFRATLQGYFLPSSVIIVAGHGIGGLWSVDVWKYFLLSLPVTLLTIWLGNRMQRLIPPGLFDKWIHVALILVGILLIIKTV
jgi:uncharacterized membrane protein YfcA